MTKLNLGPRKTNASQRPGRSSRLEKVVAVLAVLEALILVSIVGLKLVDRSSSASRASTVKVHRVNAPVHMKPTPPPPPYPSVLAMEQASTYLQSRDGETAFAVADTDGKVRGLNMHRTYLSASVAKAMLLVAYLRALAAQHGTLGSYSQALLYPMIHLSDNKAASAVFSVVGDAGIEAVARRAGMTDFVLGVDWANEAISAADQARFFYRMDRLIPRQFRAYARELLSGIADNESWGIPAAARPRWQVFFKGGWRLTGTGQLVSQIARLEQPGHKIAIAVLTGVDPSMGYGEDTIEGVTRALLAQERDHGSAGDGHVGGGDQGHGGDGHHHGQGRNHA